MFFLPYINMNQPQVHMCPFILNAPPHHPSGFGCSASRIKLALVVCFTYGNIHISMRFSQIIPPSPSSTESKSLFFIPVSLLLPCRQDHCYRLSKFHIYVLTYNICVSPSDLLHSVFLEDNRINTILKTDQREKVKYLPFFPYKIKRHIYIHTHIHIHPIQINME